MAIFINRFFYAPNQQHSHLSSVAIEKLLLISDDVLIASPFCYPNFTEFADVEVSSGVKRVRFVEWKLIA